MQVYLGKLNPETGKYKVTVGDRVISKDIYKAMGALIREKQNEQEEVVSL